MRFSNHAPSRPRGSGLESVAAISPIYRHNNGTFQSMLSNFGDFTGTNTEMEGRGQGLSKLGDSRGRVTRTLGDMDIQLLLSYLQR